MNKKTKLTTIIIGCIAVIILGLSAFYFTNITAVSKKSKEVTVTIKEGTTQTGALSSLKAAGLIKNELVAKVYLKLHPLKNIQANTYLLDENMDLSTLLDTLEKAPFERILKSKFTVVEGSRITDVAKSVAAACNMDYKQVLKKWDDEQYIKTLIKDYDFLTSEVLDENIKHPLEGYLYPETYFVTGEENSLENITTMLLDTTGSHLKPLEKSISNMGYSTHEFLTLASIVECESLFDEDKPMIAGVFINRLNDGMRLQSDVTVNYALDKTGVEVSYKQLETDSFYNTYKHSGLPVGPISNVSVDTMKSTINYKKSNYYYFFADKDGKVLYSKTLKEHEDTVKKYRWY